MQPLSLWVQHKSSGFSYLNQLASSGRLRTCSFGSQLTAGIMLKRNMNPSTLMISAVRHDRVMPMIIFSILLAQSDVLFDAVTGYRVSHYRGVIPSAPPHVQRIDDAQAEWLHHRRRAVFVDVTPAAGAKRDPDSGTWQLAEPHVTIPGAHWFPEVGRGDADPAISRWFLDGVARLTHQNRSRTLVVFCLADCWMSWNASYRLSRAGYSDVMWYANGADGWRDLGYPLKFSTPAE